MRVIPKITHQIWFQGWDHCPSDLQKNVELLSNMNPDYEHMKWNEHSLREECMKIDPLIAARFDAYEHMIQKIDFGRYVVLYNYGGISVDTDMKSLKSIDSTPNIDISDFIISESSFPLNLIGYINNALIIVKPQHPILRNMLFKMARSFEKESDYISKEKYILNTTGPEFIGKHVYENKQHVHILPYTYFEPCFSIDPVCKPSSTTIMDHQHKMSWIHPFFKIIGQILIFMLYAILYMSPLLLIYAFYRTSSIKKIYRTIVG